MNMMERIAEAEAKADMIRKDGATAARDVLAQSKTDCENDIAAAVSLQRTLTGEAIKRAEAEGELLAEDITDKQRGQSKELCMAAKEKHDAAVAYIMERIETAV